MTYKQKGNRKKPEYPAKLGISGQKGANNYYDKSVIHLPRHYFPRFKIACKMGISGAKEVKFTTFAGKKLIELKLIDGVLANITVGMSFLFNKSL